MPRADRWGSCPSPTSCDSHRRRRQAPAHRPVDPRRSRRPTRLPREAPSPSRRVAHLWLELQARHTSDQTHSRTRPSSRRRPMHSNSSPPLPLPRHCHCMYISSCFFASSSSFPGTLSLHSSQPSLAAVCCALLYIALLRQPVQSQANTLYSSFFAISARVLLSRARERKLPETTDQSAPRNIRRLEACKYVHDFECVLKMTDKIELIDV